MGVSIAALGRMIFFDRALSSDGNTSCASCHRPDRAYSDGLRLATGTGGARGTRNTPSLLDVVRQRRLFWDGRRDKLEDQALDPLLNPIEHGLVDEPALLARLRSDARYDDAFRTVYGVSASAATTRQVTQALAAFERTLVSGASPFDRFLMGRRDAIPEPVRQGWIVFDQQVRCTRCHIVADDGQPPLFTDHQFHSLSIGLDRVEHKLSALTSRLVDRHRDGRAQGRGVLDDADLAELGRFAVTLDPRDLAAFKTPSLRNVAVTAPYMHDGSITTLGEAVDFEVYARGARDERPPILTPVERGYLIAFLEALTSDN